jgi:hypothetical protein
MPNLLKLKGAQVVVGAIERRDASIFQPVFTQTGVDHAPQMIAKDHDVWRFGVVSLPAPKEMGDAYMCAFVAKKNDAAIARYFTLEYDYVLATKTSRTVLCERESARTVKLGEGPPVTNDFATDATSFVDAIMNTIGGTNAPPPAR